MNILKAVLTTTFVSLLFNSASANDATGLYASATFGLNTLSDENFDVALDGTFGSGEASFESSFGTGGAVGYRFDNGFSIEGEYMYRRVELDSVSLGDLGEYVEGDFANTQLNLNGFYHFGEFSNFALEPYVGLGLAYINEVDADLERDGVEQEFESDDFALELMAGARYRLLERGFVDVGVRYLALGEVTLKSPSNSANTVTAEYNPIMVTASFGWRF